MPELVVGDGVSSAPTTCHGDRERVCVCVCVKVTVPPCAFSQPTVMEDFGHLPPEQRRKRLQQKLDDIGKELQKEVDQRCVWGSLTDCCGNHLCDY